MLIEQYGPIIEAQPGVTVLACPFRGGASIVSVILVHAGGLALVDAGVPETQREVIEPQLAARGLKLADVRAVVLTHADWDHAGSAEGIVEASGAKIICHPQSANRLNLSDAVEIADGGTFEAGGLTWQGIHTPGHRRDMLSAYAPDRKLLIVSDSVQGWGTPWARFPLLGYSGQAYRDSLERVLKLDVQTLILGHPYRWSGEPAFVRQGAEAHAFLAESLQAAGEIERAVDAVCGAAGPAAEQATLINEIAEMLTPRFELELDAEGNWHSAVTSTLESYLRDRGRA